MLNVFDVHGGRGVRVIAGVESVKEVYYYSLFFLFPFYFFSFLPIVLIFYFIHSFSDLDWWRG